MIGHGFWLRFVATMFIARPARRGAAGYVGTCIHVDRYMYGVGLDSSSTCTCRYMARYESGAVVVLWWGGLVFAARTRVIDKRVANFVTNMDGH